MGQGEPIGISTKERGQMGQGEDKHGTCWYISKSPPPPPSQTIQNVQNTFPGREVKMAQKEDKQRGKVVIHYHRALTLCQSLLCLSIQTLPQDYTQLHL